MIIMDDEAFTEISLEDQASPDVSSSPAPMPTQVKSEPMAGRLNLDLLQSLTPFHSDGRDIVTEASRDLLVSCIKCQDRIRKVFFPSFEPPPGLKLVDFRSFPLDTLACALVASAISKIKDPYHFHEAINREAVDEALMDVYESLHWKKLGFQMYTQVYPDVVKDAKTNVRLRDFLGADGHIWADRLISRIMEPAWTIATQRLIVQGRLTEEGYNREMNALFLKLHLLDPQSVIPAYQFLLNQRALPAVNLELATRNYLGGPLDAAVIQHELENAERKTSTPVHVSKLSLTYDIDVYYGVDVDEFIITECRNKGFWSGKRPDNRKVVKNKDKCMMM